MSNNKKPLLTVIIPCYNCELFISECVHSIEKQNFESVEIICIDDGSTDNTLSTLREIKRNSSLNIKIFSKKNSGVSNTRNIGILQSKTPFIAFCDADDMLHPLYFSTIMPKMISENYECAYCCSTHSLNEFRSSKIFQNKAVNQRTSMDDLLFRMGNIGFSCFIYRREIIIKNKIFFDENTKFGEDREFIWKYLTNCSKILFNDSFFYYYRINKKSATKSKPTWQKTDLLKAVIRIENYLLEKGSDYYLTFKNYMFPRSMWAVAKTFAVGRDYNLFKRLKNEYDVRKNMKITIKDKDKLVSFASFLYLIHPLIFYLVVGLKK